MKVKIALALSGGMDSTTLLGLTLNAAAEAINQNTWRNISIFDIARAHHTTPSSFLSDEKVDGVEVYAINFYYGSKHNDKEQIAILKIYQYYRQVYNYIDNLKFELIREDLTGVFKTFNRDSSTLLKNDREIPEVHYEAPEARTTVVPGRNTIMNSIMLGFLESMIDKNSEIKEQGIIIFGPHMGDFVNYPDCRSSYVNNLNKAIQEATEGDITLITPYLDWNVNKVGILRLGLAINVPYELTWTCYNGDHDKHCGKCPACIERKEAFDTVGVEDPVEYEN